MMVVRIAELPRWWVLCVWTVSTPLGFVLFCATVFPFFILDPGPWLYPIGSATGALFGLLIGAAVGYSQRRVMPATLLWVGGWTWATARGWALGGSLVIPVCVRLLEQGRGVMDGSGVVVLLISLGSLGISVSQWLLLRQRLPAAGWWIVATVGVWGVGGLVTWILIGLLPLTPPRDQGWFMWAELVPYAGLPGFLTGVLWRRLVRSGS